jgi:hypothetical protein
MARQMREARVCCSSFRRNGGDTRLVSWSDIVHTERKLLVVVGRMVAISTFELGRFRKEKQNLATRFYG